MTSLETFRELARFVGQELEMRGQGPVPGGWVFLEKVEQPTDRSMGRVWYHRVGSGHEGGRSWYSNSSEKFALPEEEWE